MTTDATAIQNVIDGAKEELDAYIKAVDLALGDTAVGAKEPSDMELVAFFAKMNKQYPPQMYRMPDGSVTMSSPWILAQAFTANGSEWINRYNRIVARYGAM